MTDDNSNNFADRLKRIEEKNQTDGMQPPKPSTWEPPKVRRKSGISGTTQVLMVCGAVAVGSGAYLAMNMPDDLLVLGETMSGVAELRTIALTRQRDFMLAMSDDETGEKHLASDDDPDAFDRAQGRLGYMYGTGYAVSADSAAVPVDAVFANYAPVTGLTPPEPVAAIAVNEGCTLRPVGAGETLVNVNVRQARDVAPVQFADDTDVVNTLERAVSKALGDGQSIEAYPANPNHTRVINVMVTDTSAPLYLALQTLEPNALWSLHTAPGVQIAHVALVSPGSAGVTGALGDASIEWVSAAANTRTNMRNPYDFHEEPAEMDCMTRAFREPNETWGAWAGSEGGNTMDGNLLFGQHKGFAAYDYWYTTQLGVSSNTNLIEAAQTDHVLVGSVPEAPLQAVTAGQSWHFATHDHVFAGTPDATAAGYEALTGQLAIAAAGGDPFDTIPASAAIAAVDPEATLATVGGELPSIMGTPLVRDEVPRMISVTEANSSRTLRLEDTIALADLLIPGEQMPPEEHQKLYAMLRAPAIMEGRCVAPLTNIAQSCAVVEADARIQGDDVAVRAQFGYIPNYQMGHYEKSSRSTFLRIAFDERAEDTMYLDSTAQAAYIARLQSVCDTLRQQVGNCIISSASFDPDRSEGSRAFGVVEVYQTDNKFEQLKTEEIANAAYAQTVP